MTFVLEHQRLLRKSDNLGLNCIQLCVLLSFNDFKILTIRDIFGGFVDVFKVLTLVDIRGTVIFYFLLRFKLVVFQYSFTDHILKFFIVMVTYPKNRL